MNHNRLIQVHWVQRKRNTISLATVFQSNSRLPIRKIQPTEKKKITKERVILNRPPLFQFHRRFHKSASLNFCSCQTQIYILKKYVCASKRLKANKQQITWQFLHEPVAKLTAINCSCYKLQQVLSQLLNDYCYFLRTVIHMVINISCKKYLKLYVVQFSFKSES